MTSESDTRASIEATKAKAREEASKAGEKIGDEAKAVAEQAGELGREHAERRFEQGKATVEGQVDAMGAALGDAAERLREENNPLASYADELSGQLSQLSRGIENSTLDDVAVRTRQLARENPGLFVMGSMVAGLAAARFFKASAERERRERHADESDRDYGYGSDRDHGYSGGGGAMGAAGGFRRSDEYRSPIADARRPRGDAGGIGSAHGGAAVRTPMDSDRGTTGAAGSGAAGGNAATGGTGASTSGVGTASGTGGSAGIGSSGDTAGATTNRTGG